MHQPIVAIQFYLKKKEDNLSVMNKMIHPNVSVM